MRNNIGLNMNYATTNLPTNQPTIFPQPVLLPATPGRTSHSKLQSNIVSKKHFFCDKEFCFKNSVSQPHSPSHPAWNAWGSRVAEVPPFTQVTSLWYSPGNSLEARADLFCPVSHFPACQVHLTLSPARYTHIVMSLSYSQLLALNEQQLEKMGVTKVIFSFFANK